MLRPTTLILTSRALGCRCPVSGGEGARGAAAAPAGTGTRTFSPTSSGRNIAATRMYAQNTPESTNPGTMPAMNRCPIELSVSTPHTIMRMLGGISMPRQALPATQPSAKLLS